jgi:membrane protein
MKKTGKGSILGIFKTAGKDFIADSAPRLGASVAFYTIFSISPLFVIVIAIASFVFGAEAARGQVLDQISGLVGPSGAEAIQTLIAQPDNKTEGWMATIIAVGTLLIGSTAVFMELQAALNSIWEVKQKPGAGIWGFIKYRLLSFAMVLTIGFLLLVSLLLTAGLAGLGKYAGSRIPGFEAISQVLNFAISFGVITVLFAFIFKYMPDVRLPWRDVWVGAAFTSLLFSVGKLGLGMYLAKSSTASAFGAAGSLVAVLMWVYYSSQILFFGAELTQAYAKRRGTKVVPTKHAVMDVENDVKDDSPLRGKSNDSAPANPPSRRPILRPRTSASRKSSMVVPGLLVLFALVMPRGKGR